MSYVELTDQVKDEVRAEVRESILRLGFRSTIERLMLSGIRESDATQFVRFEHDVLKRTCEPGPASLGADAPDEPAADYYSRAMEYSGER